MIEGKITIDPDLDFIKKIKSGGGDHLKKCYQCATCSVSCSLSSDMNPFPRKEIVYASWGLKDKLMADPNIWHCYNCGDCSQRCPRGVRPGDVLNAIRKEAICHYSKPSIFNTLIGDPKYIPLLLLFPAIVIIVIGLITGMLNFTPSKEDIVFANFFPIPLIELIFIPLSLFSALVFFVGLKRFATDMRGQFFEQQGTKLSNKIDWIAWLKTTVSIFPSIVKHENFADCSNSKNRKLSHMMVSFSFVTLAGVAGAFVFALYVLKSHGPYSQLNPIKIIANLSGFVLILGSLMLMKIGFMTLKPRAVTLIGICLVLFFYWVLQGCLHNLHV